MKAVLIAASTLANVALIALLALRPELAPPTLRDFIGRHFSAASTTNSDSAASTPAKTAPSPASAKSPWADLSATTDLPTLIARLRAAGFPAGIIRAVVTAEVMSRYEPRMRPLQGLDPDVPYWRQTNSSQFVSAKTKQRQDDLTALQRERSRLLSDLFKDPFFTPPEAQRSGPLARLSPEKSALIQRIEEDYREMTSNARSAMGGITLPTDRETLALLDREKLADLAAVLTPAELEDYEMRNSNITSMLRSRIGNFEPTEAEFRALYAAQKGLAEKFPTGLGDRVDQDGRLGVQAEYNNQLRTVFTEERLNEYSRLADIEYQRFSRIAEQEKIPPANLTQAFDLRFSVERESHRIADDPALSVEQKRVALKQLADATRAQLGNLLGASASSYPGNSWINSMAIGSIPTFPRGAPFMISNGGGGYTIYSNSPTFRPLPPGRASP